MLTCASAQVNRRTVCKYLYNVFMYLCIYVFIMYFYLIVVLTFMKCKASTGENSPSLNWNVSIVSSCFDQSLYCSSLEMQASFQSNSASLTAFKDTWNLL